MDLGVLGVLPPVTKTLLGISTILAVAVSTEHISDQTLMFIPSRIAQGEIWRIFTGLFYVVSVLACSTFFGVRQPSWAILAALEYITTRCHEEQQLFWLFLRISPGLLPFHQLYSAWIYQDYSSAKGYLIGILIGHVFLILDGVAPKWMRRRILSLPGEPLDV